MTPSARQVRVVAALIFSDAGRRVLVQQRPAGKHLAFLWEFPGGKVEPGEDDRSALTREVLEELGVEVEVGRKRFHTRHGYPDFVVDLHVYEARIVAGAARPLAGQVLKRVALDELAMLPFCEADQPLVQELAQEASEGPGRLKE